MLKWLCMTILTVLVGLSMVGNSSAADRKKGIAAYLDGNYDMAMQELRPVAEEGDLNAQFLVGEMYFKGLGTDRDFAKAFDWYFKAAQSGHAQAQANIGSMIALGLEQTRNMSTAYYWLILSAIWTDTDLKTSAYNALSDVAPLLTPEEKDTIAARASNVWR